MGFIECLARFFQNARPYIAVISLQFGYAGMNIISVVSLNRGMSHYVLVVYRHAFATAVMAPFALVLERYISSSFILTYITILISYSRSTILFVFIVS